MTTVLHGLLFCPFMQGHHNLVLGAVFWYLIIFFCILMGVQSHNLDMPFKIVSNPKQFDGDPGVFLLLRFRARTSAKDGSKWCPVETGIVRSHLSVIRGHDTWKSCWDTGLCPGHDLVKHSNPTALAKLGDTASWKQHEWWQWQRKGFSDSSFKHPVYLENVQQRFVC